MDNPMWQEFLSLKKLLKDNCTWSTNKKILGWIIKLPDHQVKQLVEILASIPWSQKHFRITKWHKTLRELKSMALVLLGARHLFRCMQLVRAQHKGKYIVLLKGIHYSLKDFWWLSKNISKQSTRIVELIPHLASVVGHHDASKDGAGGVWFPVDHLNSQPIVWHYQWPQEIKD